MDVLHPIAGLELEDGEAEFAGAVVGATPFSGLLFALRKLYGPDQSVDLLRRLWSSSGDRIVKTIYERAGR